MVAALHRLHAEEPQSKFSPEERAKILATARKLVSEPPPVQATKPSASEVEDDVVRRWRREADEQAAAWKAERTQAVDAEQRRYRRQHQQANASQQWGDYVANQIKIAIETEREHAEALLVGIVSELTRQQQALEVEVKALRKELSSWRASR